MIVPVNLKIDAALIIWFHQHRMAGIPISGPILKIQALNFWKMFGGTKEFKASDGWLNRWKSQFGIKNTIICGEKLSSDHEGAENFKAKFKELIEAEELTPHQVFNCDETGLNWKQMPRRTLNSSQMTSAAGYKLQKERLTVMACSNAAGSFKLPLVVIGKFENPRALKNIRNKLPVAYYSQTSAWMTTGIFEKWFKEHFVPKVEEFLKSKGLPPKAILFMDNCAAHPGDIKVKDIRVEFLPPNTTPLIQPMDQGCLQALKSRYRIFLMAFLMELFQSGHNLPSALKQLTIREVIFWLFQCWENIASITITKTWKPLWPDVKKTVEIVNFCEMLIQHQPVAITDSNVDSLIEEFHQKLKKNDDFQDVNVNLVNDWAQCAQPLSEDEMLSEAEIEQCVTENFHGSGEPSLLQEDEDETDSILTTEYREKLKEKEKKVLEIKDYLNKVNDYCCDNPYYNLEMRFNLKNLMNAVEMESWMIQPF